MFVPCYDFTCAVIYSDRSDRTSYPGQRPPASSSLAVTTPRSFVAVYDMRDTLMRDTHSRARAALQDEGGAGTDQLLHNLRCINPYLSFSSMVMPHAVRFCVCLVHAVWPTSHSYYAPKCGARTPGSCPARMLPRGFITTKSLSGVYVLGPANPGGMLSESSRSALSSGWPNGRTALFV